MKKMIDTGKTKTVSIKKAVYYCDECKKLLNKENFKQTYWCDGKKYHVCKNNEKCNPFIDRPTKEEL